MCIHGILKNDPYVSKKGKLPDPKKIQAIVNMPPPKNPQHLFKYSMVWHNFTDSSLKKLLLLWHQSLN